LAFALSLAALWAPPAAKADELLTNGGFEEGTRGWTSAGGSLATSPNAYKGDASAVFTADVDGGGTGTVQPELVWVQPGATYALSAAILNDDPRVSRVRLRIDWEDSSGYPIPTSGNYRDLTTIDPDWQMLSMLAVTAPPDAVRAKVTIYVMTQAAGGQVHVDDVSLAGPPAPASTPTAAATLTPPPSSTPVPGATATSASTHTPAPSVTATEVPTATPPEMASGYLLDGGFEEASGGTLVDWESWGGTLQQTATHRRSGSYAAAYISNTESTKWVYQSVRLASGAAYVFDGYALLDDPNVSAVFLRVSWYASDDASGQAIGTTDSTERLSGDDPSFRYLTTGAMLVPLGTHSAKVRAMLVPLSSARATIYLDDMSLREAPPDSLATPVAPSPAVSEVEPLEQGIAGSGEPGTAQKPSTGQRLAATVTLGQSPHQVKVNELLYDPIQPSDDAAYEWLELYNAGAEPVDVGGWTVSDNQSADSLPSTLLPAQGFAVIAAGGRFREVYPSYGGSLIALADGRIGNGLANNGDRLVLRDAAGRLVDAVSYGDDTTALSPSIPVVAAGHSLERSPPGHDTDAAGDFVDNRQPSPGKGTGPTAVAGAMATPRVVKQVAAAEDTSTGSGSKRIPPLPWAPLGAAVAVVAAGVGAGAVYRRRTRSKEQL
jgi:hypothetical protein